MELAYTDWEKEITERSKEKNYYSEGEIRTILQILSRTFSSLQRNRICHRDIKPQNILIVPDHQYKICDFGESTIVKEYEKTHSVRGTELYMSPILFNS